MAKEFENKFFEQLRGGVIDNTPPKGSLEEKREILKKSIEELESNVIKDPRTLENLKKELAKVEKEIKNRQDEKTIESGEVVAQGVEKETDESVKEEEEKQEQKDEKQKDITPEQEEKQLADKEQLKRAYYEAMIALHERKIHNINVQKQKVPMELVSKDSDYEQEIILEAKLYEARDAYMNLGESDPYTDLRTEQIRLEKEAREPIEMELRNRSKRFKEIEIEINELDKREQEINEELLKDDITDSQIESLNKELEEIGAKRTKLELERTDIKDKLDISINTRRERITERAGLEQKYKNTLSNSDMKNYTYQQSKIDTMNKNFDLATKQHYDNIKRRIEEREQKIKDINKELKEIPDTDFERRLMLLNELDKETSMLEADKQARTDLDRGLTLDKQDELKDITEKSEKEEYRQEEFDRATEEVREVIKEQDEKLGQAVVENPNVANVEERDRNIATMAATYAVVHDSPAPGKDTVVQDVIQYEVAKSVIPGLESQVKTIDDTAEGRANAEEYLEQDKQIREADNQLDRIEENLTKF